MINVSMKDFIERAKIFRSNMENLKNEKIWQNKGFQVVMSAHNAEKFLPTVLSSIENAMANMPWVMNFGDDESTDSTLEIAERFSKMSSAVIFNIFKFNKAKSIAQAKNRVICKALGKKEEFPGIFLADADDFFTKERARELPHLANKNNSPFSVGSWYYCKNGQKILKPASKSAQKRTFGPWATLIHARLMPEDGKLFYEDPDGILVHEDVLLLEEFNHYGIPVQAFDEVIACYYNASEGTASREIDMTKRQKLWEYYTKLKYEMLSIKV
jgi:glycosyltransferase involved in cell wall biosynthesis